MIASRSGSCSDVLLRRWGCRAAVLSVVVACLVLSLGCRTRETEPQRATSAARTPEASPLSTASDTRPRIVILGDSLSAGYGLRGDESFPALLQQRMDEAGYEYRVVNMGVSGDTSAGGVSRLDWALDGEVRVLVVALGGNDGLRGLPPGELEANLTAIVDRAQARKVAVLLCGMESPPNFGASYTSEFREVYRRLAREKRVELLPFLLQGVAGDPSLNQPDGIHPNAEGARRVADLVWDRLQPMLDATRS